MCVCVCSSVVAALKTANNTGKSKCQHLYAADMKPLICFPQSNPHKMCILLSMTVKKAPRQRRLPTGTTPDLPSRTEVILQPLSTV